MKILFLSRWFPYPTNNGSKLRIYNLLRGLAEHHDVTLLSFADQENASCDTPELKELCSDIYVVPWREYKPHSVSAGFGLLNPKPRSFVDTFSAQMAKKITQLLHSTCYDLVIASQLSMAAYRPYFRSIPALFEELEIGLSYSLMHQTSDSKKRFRHTLSWLKLRMYLSQLLRSFQMVTVVSQQERKLVSQFFPIVENISVIPNCVNLADYRDLNAEPSASKLVFTGSFRYSANYEAMLWFVGEVFPRILECIPDIELIITGDHANLPLPSDKNIIFTGSVAEIKSLIASSTVAVAPLWSGGGTRLKILEAMAIGTPMVATSKGAEGLDVRNGEHLFIADDPAEFSNCVIQLLVDVNLRQNIAKKARLLVEEKYDWEKQFPDFMQSLQSICAK